jgi:hypothetical protein
MRAPAIDSAAAAHDWHGGYTLCNLGRPCKCDPTAERISARLTAEYAAAAPRDDARKASIRAALMLIEEAQRGTSPHLRIERPKLPDARPNRWTRAADPGEEERAPQPAAKLATMPRKSKPAAASTRKAQATAGSTAASGGTA